MVASALLTSALAGFLSQAVMIDTSFTHKIAFDLDRIGRTREIAYIEEGARSTYEKNGMRVNIAVWNMHVPADTKFNHILDTGLKPMGRGGGFRVVVFTGDGSITIGGEGGPSNWRVSGNVLEEGDSAQFRATEGCDGAWGCMNREFQNWMQGPL
jgi:hypothetical protein